MRVRQRMLAAVVVVAAALPAQAALILEYVEVTSTAATLSNGPALTSLTMDPAGANSIKFIQVVLRDTTGAGPNGGQPPGTVNWQTNGGLAGPGSLGIASFFVRFDGIPLVAVNPAPQNATNARLVNQIDYGLIASGSNPPNFTNIGGLLNFGSEPGAVPDPAFQNRIPLFNLRITALGAGTGTFRLRDPNPAPSAVDNSLLENADPFGIPNPGTIVSIDNLLFPGGTFSYDLPIVVTPEPTSLALAGLALAGLGYRKLRRKTVA